MTTQGTFHTLRIQESSNIQNLPGVKVFGTRIAKFLPDGWIHRANLTPSRELLFESKDLEKKGEWNVETFDSFYRPRYFQEIQKNIEAKKELAYYLQLLKQGKDVYYACYCRNYKMCHRGLVGKLIKKNGGTVIFQ